MVFYISTFGIIFLYIFGKIISSAFDNDIEVINYSFEYLLIEVWVFYAYIILFICVSTLQAIKKPIMIIYIALYRQIIAKLLVAYLVVVYWQLDFIYLWVGVLIMIYSAAIFTLIYTRKMLKNVTSKNVKINR